MPNLGPWEDTDIYTMGIFIFYNLTAMERERERDNLLNTFFKTKEPSESVSSNWEYPTYKGGDVQSSCVMLSHTSMYLMFGTHLNANPLPSCNRTTSFNKLTLL